MIFLAKAINHAASLSDTDPDAKPAAAEPETSTPKTGDVYAVASQIADFYHATAHPEDLLTNCPEFEAGVADLRDPSVSVDTLINYVTGDNAIISCLAIEALRRREDGDRAWRANRARAWKLRTNRVPSLSAKR